MDQVVPITPSPNSTLQHIKNTRDSSIMNHLHFTFFIELARNLLKKTEVAEAISHHKSHDDGTTYDPSNHQHHVVSDVVYKYLSSVFPTAYR